MWKQGSLTKGNPRLVPNSPPKVISNPELPLGRNLTLPEKVEGDLGLLGIPRRNGWPSISFKYLACFLHS
jgi:hypothetical protein